MSAIKEIFKNFFKLLSQKTEITERVIYGIVMIFIVGLPILLGGRLLVLLLIILGVFITSEYITISKNPKRFVLVFIAFNLFTFYLLRESGSKQSMEGLQKVIFLVLSVTMFDTFAYFIGKKFGHRKLCPTISPNKTFEGLVGGMVGVILVAVPFYYILNIHLGLASYIFLALLIAGISQIGDIMESAFKRRHNVKDSSDLIPGHGGVLDRFDGYILTVPFFFFADLLFNLF